MTWGTRRADHVLADKAVENGGLADVGLPGHAWV